MSPVSPVNPASASAQGARGPWRAVIVDDQALLVSAFEMLLSSQPDLEVVGTAADGAAALELLGSRAQQLQGAAPVDVVLMDIRMPVMDGVTAIRAMRTGGDDQNDEHSAAREALRRTPVLVLTTFDEDEAAFAALDSGASGFLLKDATTWQLADAIAAVANGDAVLAPRITRELLARSVLNQQPQPRLDERQAAARALLRRLSERELEVLVAVGRGLTNAEIAETQHLAPSSVKTYISRLLTKLGRRDRVGLVTFAEQPASAEHWYYHCSQGGGMTAIWAHRGASAYAPENTIPAFEQAIEMWADGVEFDVQRTSDGQLVVIHDETITRTSNGFGRVVDLTLEQLRL